MKYTTCQLCEVSMPASFAACPRCGTFQDNRLKAEEAYQARQYLLTIVPVLIGALAGWFIFESTVAVFCGMAIGWLFRLGFVAWRYGR